MSHEPTLEDRLEFVGAFLQTRPSVVGRMMDQLRQPITHSTTLVPSARIPRFRIDRRRRFLATAGTVATFAVAIPIIVMLFPSRSVGWTEVVEAIQSQKWIRGTATLPDGKRATMWFAPKREIWAFELPGSFLFYDGREKVKYEHRSGDKMVTRLPLGEEDAQRVLPTDALSLGKSTIGPWLMGTEKIVGQKRREFTEEGKTWIEFQLVLWRGEMNHATLRVDPETRLPVYLLAVSPKDDTKTSKWVFDYPSDGPADIYALGVSRDTKIDDLMPADNVQRMVAAMVDARASIGDFRMIVDQSPHLGSSVVYRKGNKWRVDSWRARSTLEAPAGRDWTKWLELQQPVPLYICDGTSVWQNASVLPGEAARWNVIQQIAPQDLMSGEGLGMLSGAPGAKFASLVYPDLSPKRGWDFEFDANPVDAPGCVLLKRSARVTWPMGAVGHEWYYLDPAKKYAVVRAELFNLPPDVPINPEAAGRHRQTIRLEEYHESPQGFWYPTVVQNTMANLSSERAVEAANWHFAFDLDLPDSLFIVNAAPQR